MLALILQLLGIIVSAGAVAVSVGVLRGPTVRAQQLAASISNLQALREAQSQEPSPSQAQSQGGPRFLDDEHVKVARKEVRLAVAAIDKARTKKERWAVLITGAGATAVALICEFLGDALGGPTTTAWGGPLSWITVTCIGVSIFSAVIVEYRVWSVRIAEEDLQKF